MKTSEKLVQMYNLIHKEFGPLEAKNSLHIAIFNVISEIQEEGIEVTVFELETRIEAYVNDLVQIAKKSDVA